MIVEVTERPASCLAEYARTSIAFTVRRVLDAAPRADGSFSLTERPLDPPYTKDYDECPEDLPTSWPGRFDLSRWGFLCAHVGGSPVGWAAIAFDTLGVEMLEGRRDLAVLWDIRVSTEARGRGVGVALFRAVEEWARFRVCRELKVETQNINAPACRFYERQGCVLRGVNPGAYPGLPDEVQFLWFKRL
jgi:GNAT superfamily N-acetyltransferase